MEASSISKQIHHLKMSANPDPKPPSQHFPNLLQNPDPGITPELDASSTSKRRSPCFFEKIYTEDELAGTKFQRQHSQIIKTEASISNSRIGI
jgi:hypothetical protein